MAGRSETSVLDFLFRFLVAYRLLFYLGGLVVMSVPLLVEWASDASVPQTARNTIVAVSFGAILLTYVAERRVGLDHVDPATGAPREPYSRRAWVSVVLAIAGIAVGVYLVLERDTAMGVLFLVGALLFFQLAYRAERPDDEATEG